MAYAIQIRKKSENGAPAEFFNTVVLKWVDDDCVLWPYAKYPSGYGQMRVDGSLKTVSRLVCEHVNGPPPHISYDAAHSCGKGHLGCVTPGHMSWKTRSENIADMVGHGTARRGEKAASSVLTESAVREIRSLHGLETQEVIAEKYGISRKTVSKIHLRQRWGWLE